MLSHLLELRGFCSFPVAVERLASEMVDDVEKRQAHIICVSAMPPAAVTHSRYLCKRLHAKYPNTDMVVGLWTARGDLKKARDRITCSPTVQITTTLVQALDQIQQLAQPIIVRETATGEVPAPGKP